MGRPLSLINLLPDPGRFQSPPPHDSAGEWVEVWVGKVRCGPRPPSSGGS